MWLDKANWSTGVKVAHVSALTLHGSRLPLRLAVKLSVFLL